MVNDLIRNIETKIEVTPTQKLAAIINSGILSSSFDLVKFCETRGIDLTNLWKVSRLYQFEENLLVDFWNYCLGNNPSLLDSIKDPSVLYQNVLNFQNEQHADLRFLENLGFSTIEVEKLESQITFVMATTLEKHEKLIQANLNYLKEIQVKNVSEIFTEYYELFLLDNSNFVNIFNKYDPEDLIEKLVKNIAIVEYL